MANLIALQGSLAATGTAQNVPPNPVTNSVVVSAPAANSAAIAIGNTSAVTTATGYNLDKGTSVILPLRGGNTNAIWVVGTSGDKFSVAGS